jgi:hypothetical protein
MTSPVSVPSRVRFPALVCAASLALSASFALAQTAPRYTARELPKVASSVVCGVSVAINEAGDVSQNCLYNAGSYSTTQDVCYDYLGICYKTRVTKQVNYLLPAVWPASGGGARALSTSVRSYSTGTIVADGSVLGRSGPIGTRGEPIGEPQIVRWLPPYSAVPQVVSVPAALQREGFVSYGGPTKGGGIWWRDASETKHAVVGADGRAWLVPSPPPLTNPDETLESDTVLAVQDGSQAVRTRVVAQRLPSGQDAFRFEAWYVRDQQWSRTPLTSDQSRVDSATLTTNGVVLYSQGGRYQSWRADQPANINALITSPDAGRVQAINASGLAGGAVPIPNDKKFRTKAQVWWQGQALELQGRVTGLPSSWQLRSVEAINDRGQLVVQAEDTSIFTAANSAYKTVLLTPQ